MMQRQCSRNLTSTEGTHRNFKKESKRLLRLGVPGHKNYSKGGAPYFPQSKEKMNRVIFLSDFRNLNRHLKRKPYHMQ